jgi:hypothetical protein
MVPKKPNPFTDGALPNHCWASLFVVALLLTSCGNPVATTSPPVASTSSIPSPVPPPVIPRAGTATLTWTRPTENTDGTPLTNLAGYYIYYGTDSSNFTQTIDIIDPTTTNYMITGLHPGTYYFAVTAYNAFRIESAKSNIASKTI